MIPTWGAAFGANAIFNSAEFRADLTHSAVPDKAAPGTTATFTRATTATVRDNEGVLRTAIAGEARFEGARRVRNVMRKSEDFSGAEFTKTNCTVAKNLEGPDGVANSACTVTATGASALLYDTLGITPASCTKAVTSVYLKRITGTGTVQISANGANTNVTVALTTSWQRFEASATTLVSGTFPAILIATSGDAIGVAFWQEEDVTAQTTQTAGEYVSVGVESAPYYHGSMVDGVKCFPTDLAGDALPTAYTYDAVSLNGVAGTYVSTPDSVAASVTGDIDIRVKAALVDWTPAVATVLFDKMDSAGNQRAYQCYINTNGTVGAGFDPDGSAPVTTATSTAAVSFSASETGWVRVTRAASTGYVNFYTSSDGVSWTQLGNADVASYVGAIFDSSSILCLGALVGGATNNLSGTIYQAQIYNGIDGTLAVDFDASRYEGGTTLTGSTGETWTLQGNAVIHPTNQPALGFQAEGARTNLCLQSQTLQTATWAVSAGANPISVNSSVAPDGTTTADLLYEKSDAVVKYVAQSITITTAAHTWSVYAKENGRRFLAIDAYDGSQHLSYFDLVNGTTGTNAAGNTSSIESVGDGWYRCSVTRTAAGTGGYIQLHLAEVDNSISYTGDGSSGIYLWGAQLELGSFASSYIATTTAAVTRNADVLTYSGGDVPNLKTLTATFKRESGVESVGWAVALSDGTISNYESISAASATEARFLGVTGGVTQWDVIPSYTAGTTSKAAFSAATNDIKMAKDGVAQTQDTSATVPTVTQLNVGHVAGSFQFSGNVGGIYGWTRNLSQSELNAVTS